MRMTIATTGHPAPFGPALSGLERYRLIQKLEQEEGRSSWYAKLREADHEGQVGDADDAGGLEGRVRRRTEIERLLCVYAPPSGDIDDLSEAAARWGATVASESVGMRHPHILYTHDASASDPLCPLIALEFPDGGTLARLLDARGKVEPGECAQIVNGVGRALSWLHGRGIVHGNIRPTEVHFSVSGVPLIKPPWSDPWRERPESGPGAVALEVFDFAAMIWRMLTGRAPGPSVSRFPLPMVCPSTPRPVVDVLESALNDSPESRPDVREVVLAVTGAWESMPLPLRQAAYPEFVRRLPVENVSGSVHSKTQHTPLWGGIERVRAASRGRGGARISDRSKPTGEEKTRTVPDGQSFVKARVARSLPHGRFPASKRSLILAGAVAMAAGGAMLGSRWWVEEPQATNSLGHSQPSAEASDGLIPRPSGMEPAKSENGDEGQLTSEITSLFEARDRALRDADAEKIALYAERGGAVEQQDLKLIQELHTTKTRWPDLHSAVSDIQVEKVADERAEVVVTLTVTGWNGPTAQEPKPQHNEAGASSQRIRIGLGRATGSWKFSDVTPMGT